MDRHRPPKKEGPGLLDPRAPWKTESHQLLLPFDPIRNANFPLLLRRERAGLLTRFQCVRCGEFSLDPVGYDAKHRWICSDCLAVADFLEWSREP
jgi:hypothetical protein